MRTLRETTRGPIRYGEVAADGSRLMYALPNGSEALTCIGRLMPEVDKSTLIESAPYRPGLHGGNQIGGSRR